MGHCLPNSGQEIDSVMRISRRVPLSLVNNVLGGEVKMMEAGDQLLTRSRTRVVIGAYTLSARG